MRKKLFSLLAAAVLGKFMVPAAAAQVPEAGVLGMPSVSAKAWLGYESTNTSAPMGGFWLEFAANQGPIARALGLPAPAAPKRRGTLALNAGCDAVPDGSIFTYACFANSLPSDNSVGFQAAKYESGRRLLPACGMSHGDCRPAIGLCRAHGGPRLRRPGVDHRLERR